MVSICYWALVGQVDVASLEPKHNVAWFAEDALPELAFDHRRIVDYAIWRLRHRLDMPKVVRELVGGTFTLRELHAVSEGSRDTRSILPTSAGARSPRPAAACRASCPCAGRAFR